MLFLFGGLFNNSVFDLEEKKREKKENYGNHKTSVGIFI
jgi:hypothetical protein